MINRPESIDVSNIGRAIGLDNYNKSENRYRFFD